MMEKDKREFTELLFNFFVLNSNFSSFLHFSQMCIVHTVSSGPSATELVPPWIKICIPKHFTEFVKLCICTIGKMDGLITIYMLLKIARDKAVEQHQKLAKGKISHRICDIQKRHRRAASCSVLANIQRTSETSLQYQLSYTISSESKKGVTYAVQKVKTLCDKMPILYGLFT